MNTRQGSRFWLIGQRSLTLMSVALAAILVAGCSPSQEIRLSGDFLRLKPDDVTMKKAELALAGLARQVQQYPLPPHLITDMHISFLRDHPEFVEVGFAYGPNSDPTDSTQAAPMVFIKDGQPTIVDLTDFGYDYQGAKWFEMPQQTGEPYWSPRYMNRYTNEQWVRTYAIPIFEDEYPNRLIGVVTGDIPADEPVFEL